MMKRRMRTRIVSGQRLHSCWVNISDGWQPRFQVNEWLKGAISNWRQMQETIKEMQRLSRGVLFGILPHQPRRKKLGKRALGLI
jgi:hypothetical protein